MTAANADIDTFSITDDGSLGLTGDNFNLADGVLSLKDNFAALTDNTEKTLTLTVNYKKKADAGANTTLSKTTDTKTFKIVKAEKLDDNKVSSDLKSLLVVSGFAFKTSFQLQSGIGTLYEHIDKIDTEQNTGDFVTAMNTQISNSKDINFITGVDFLNVEVSTDKKTATFSFILKVKDQYETTYNSEKTPLKLKCVIGDTQHGQGGIGTWKDTTK